MKIGTFGLIGAAVVTSAVSADFTGWQTEVIQLASGRYAVNVYAGFSATTDRLVNVFNGQISTDAVGGFYQAASNPFWRPGNTQNHQTADDSFVAIGINPNGNGNVSGSITAGDPDFINFDDANESSDFSVIEGGGLGAGWYNNNPGNTWGFANMGGTRVLAAHFVVEVGEGSSAPTLNWSVEATVRYASGAAPIVGGGSFSWIIPGPGALAFVGLAGLTSRRRRA